MLGKRDGDHLAITNASFTSVRLRPHRRAIFPSKKKKTSLPMRKSRQTEHPHMNFRRLAASDAVTPAFLPGVSQIKRPCGEHAALCSDARHGPRPRGEPAPNGIPSDFLFIFNQCPVREGSSRLPQAHIEWSFKFGLGAEMSPACVCGPRKRPQHCKYSKLFFSFFFTAIVINVARREQMLI